MAGTTIAAALDMLTLLDLVDRGVFDLGLGAINVHF